MQVLGGHRRTEIVTVIAVLLMKVAADPIIDVIAVWNRLMATAATVATVGMV